ncbi:MAG: hypothetical protein KDB80_00735 [Planctomycetes bacterium]|nr:hypothetical protein [Planctomycetota bacterium]
MPDAAAQRRWVTLTDPPMLPVLPDLESDPASNAEPRRAEEIVDTRSTQASDA